MPVLKAVLLLILFQPSFAEISVASDSAVGVYSLTSVLSTGANEMTLDGYVLYNELQVVDPGREVTVRPLYVLSPPEIEGTPGKFEDFKGSIVTIRGKNYLVTEAQFTKLTLGEGYAEVSLLKQAASDAKIAKPLAGNVKVLLTGATSDTTKLGLLRVFEDDKEVGALDLDTGKSGSSFSNRSELTSYLQEITRQLDGYLIFLTNTKPVRIAAIKKDRLFDIIDEQKDVLGYKSVRVNNPEFKGGTNKIKFLGRTYTLKIDTSVPLEEAEYYTLRLSEKRKFWIDVGYIPPTTTAPPTITSPTKWRGLNIKNDASRLRTLGEAGIYGDIKVDANCDGDTGDEEDYSLYNELLVVDGSRAANLKLIYTVAPPKLDEFFEAPLGYLKGTIIKIRDRSYLVTDVESGKIVLGEAPIVKTLSKQEKLDPASAVAVEGKLKLSITGNPKESSPGTLNIFSGDALVGTVDLNKYSNKSEISSAELPQVLLGYRVFIINLGAWLPTQLALAKKDSLVSIFDEQPNVLGYEIAKVDNAQFPGGRNKLKLVSKLYSIPRGGEEELADNAYYLCSGTSPYKLQFNDEYEFRIFEASLPKPTPPSTKPPEMHGIDFGDAPDPSYPSRLASNGARHLDIGRAWFGKSVDAEADSQQVDKDAFDDGLTSWTPITFVVTNKDWQGELFVNILIDWNGDGDWSDAGEWAGQNMAISLSPGQSQEFKTDASMALLTAAPKGDIWLRMTLTSIALSNYTGKGEFKIGETEDHVYKKLPLPAIPSNLTLYERLNESKEALNKYMETAELPGFIKGVASARVIIHVEDETASVVIENGKITSVVKGKIDNPTNEIWMTREFLEKLASAKNPAAVLAEGRAKGEFKKEDYGASAKAKGFLTNLMLGITGTGAPKPLPEEKKEERKLEDEIGKVAKKTPQGTFVIDEKTTNLKKTALEVSGKDLEKKPVKIEEYSGYKPKEAPPDVPKPKVSKEEVPLGTYLKVEVPKEIDWVVLKIKYADEELKLKGMDEDSLAFSYYDDDAKSSTYGTWIKLSKGSPSWVNDAGINKAEKYVWANVSHASVYGVSGTIVTKPQLAGWNLNYSSPVLEELPYEEEQPGLLQRIINFFKRLLGRA